MTRDELVEALAGFIREREAYGEELERTLRNFFEMNRIVSLPEGGRQRVWRLVYGGGQVSMASWDTENDARLAVTRSVFPVVAVQPVDRYRYILPGDPISVEEP